MAGQWSIEEYWKNKTDAATYVPYNNHQRKSPSSSKSSGFPYTHTILSTHIMKLGKDTLDFAGCCDEKYRCYDLDNVHVHYLNSQYTSSKRRVHKDAAECCVRVLKHFAESCGKRLEFETENSLNLSQSSMLAPFLSSLEQRPDISVSLSDECTAALLGEIHSSPYEDTLRKTVISALDLLRLRRMYSDEVSEITAFSFPKFDNDHCVVKVVVTWKDFTFWYTLEPIVAIEKIEKEVVAAFKRLVALPNPSPKREQQPDKYCNGTLIMRLSETELATFEGGNRCQVPAKAAIIVRTDQFMYKRPIFKLDSTRLSFLLFMLHNRVACEGILKVEFSFFFFKYPRIHFDAMVQQEVKECTKDFYSKVYFTLNEIHKKLNLVHLDIRVENMF